nr:hypothetical protein [Okeania sp. SIO2C9]
MEQVIIILRNAQEYLVTINQDLVEEEWLINCTKFAPNAPEQNPVEDIWLQAKNFTRQFYHLCSSFKVVKWLFKFFALWSNIRFPKTFSVWNFATTNLGLLYIVFFFEV